MPRRAPPLSAKALAAVRAGSKPIEKVDGQVPGLRVRIMPSGERVWSLSVRDSKGERRRFAVGTALSLAEARRKAEELRRDIRDGADPTSERRAARQRTKDACRVRVRSIARSPCISRRVRALLNDGLRQVCR